MTLEIIPPHSQPGLPLEQRITQLEQEIKMQQATIAKLLADGHEVTDAQGRLVHLLETLETALRTKTELK